MHHLHSEFLPEDFDHTKPVALIAGKGRYPQLLCERMEAAGLDVCLIAFEDETSPELWDHFDEEDRVSIRVGKLGKLLKSLKKFGAGYAVMAGQITPKKLFRGMTPDVKALAVLARLKERNAETIFGAIASEIEHIGVQQLDARILLDDQLATVGQMSAKTFDLDEAHLEHGVRIAKGAADLDIGQGVVVRKGTVIAVEAFEGTDNMLRRAGGIKPEKAIFVKSVKNEQDYRFDVPVFGLRTIETMAEAKIRYAALEAGRVIMLDKEKVLEEAKRLKICLVGF